jgi:hypothetical protein
VFRRSILCLLAGTLALTLDACGGGASHTPTSPTPITPTKPASINGTMTASVQQVSGAHEYTMDIKLAETAGTSAKMTSVSMTFFAAGAEYAELEKPYGDEAWLNDNPNLPANGGLISKHLVVRDESPTEVADRVEAKVSYTDSLQNSGTVTISATVPPPTTSTTAAVGSGSISTLRRLDRVAR